MNYESKSDFLCFFLPTEEVSSFSGSDWKHVNVFMLLLNVLSPGSDGLLPFSKAKPTLFIHEGRFFLHLLKCIHRINNLKSDCSYFSFILPRASAVQSLPPSGHYRLLHVVKF